MIAQVSILIIPAGLLAMVIGVYLAKKGKIIVK
jgi:phosphate starvation-inducible membrane PsiE